MRAILHQFDFYNLINSDYFRPAMQIAEKVLKNSNKLLIIAPENELPYWSTKLWTDKKDSFIAHGMGEDDVSDFAPIWLSSSVEDNPINAEFIVLTNGLGLESFSSFKRVFYLFDGSSKAALAQARTQWQNWSSNPQHICRYFCQDEKGRWQAGNF